MQMEEEDLFGEIFTLRVGALAVARSKAKVRATWVFRIVLNNRNMYTGAILAIHMLKKLPLNN